MATPQRPLTFLLTLAAAAVLTGCSTDIELSTANLPTPALALVAAPATCAGATGSAVIVLDDTSARLTLDGPAQAPVNRLVVGGTVTGLGVDEAVLVGIVPPDASCPITSIATATVDAEGGFTATVNILTLAEFRAVALVTDADPAEISCTGDCIDLGAGTLAAISEGLLVVTD